MMQGVIFDVNSKESNIEKDLSVIIVKRDAGWLILMGIIALFFFGAALFQSLVNPKLLESTGNMVAISAFAIFGLAITFGRLRITIDRGCGVLERGYTCMGIPFTKKRYPLDHFNRVCLVYEERTESSGEAGGSRVDTYPVLLAGTGNPEWIEIEAPKKYSEARKRAREIALYLDIPLKDGSCKHTETGS